MTGVEIILILAGLVMMNRKLYGNRKSYPCRIRPYCGTESE